MNQHPFMVAGTGREDTDLMNSLQESKIFSKGGAEAVWCAGFPEKGLGLAFKIEDGASRASSPIMAEILRQARLVPTEMIERFAALQVKPLTNKRNLVVGEYQPAFTLRPSWKD
jgi:L-asparaginase II